MAPERFAGAPGDPRLDVYALGLLLHEMITGLLPFASRYEDRDTPTVLLHKRLTTAVPPPSASFPLSPQLLALHADLLDREPLRRPAHAGEVRQRLRDIPEASSLLRMSLEIPIRPLAPSGASGAREAPAGRSIPPGLDGESPASRSLPPLVGLDGQPITPAARSIPPTPTPASISHPAPPAAPSQALRASLSSMPAPATAGQEDITFRERETGGAAKTSRTLTKWLLIGSCLVLALLLILLALS